VGGGVDTLMLVLVALCPGVDPRLVPHWASPAATAAATLPARSIPIPSPTAAAHNGCAGSGSAWRAGRSSAATPSPWRPP